MGPCSSNFGDMSLDDSGLAIAGQATRALGSLERYGHVLRPPGAHEVTWRLEMLDELTRAGHHLAGAVARVVGDDPVVEGVVRELTSAIDLHCDRLVRAIRDRPGPTSGSGRPPERLVAVPTPYVRSGTTHGTATGAAAVPTDDPTAQRDVIGTAAELLMTRLGCGVDAAYALILERARDSGSSTYEVAARVVEEG